MKALWWIVGIVLLVLVAVGVYVVVNSGALLERGIETYGSRYLGAPVEVGRATVSLGEASSSVEDLVVGNPDGFDGPPALRLGEIAATLNSAESTSQLIVLEQVVIDGAQVNALVRGTRANLTTLMDNLNRQISANQQAEETGVESEVQLVIDRLSFTNATASVDSDLAGQATVDIPDLQLTDIGRDTQGATVGQVLQQVLEPVFEAVLREVARQGVDLEGAREQLEQGVRERFGDELRGLESMRERLKREQP
jgi:hypothetical protein